MERKSWFEQKIMQHIEHYNPKIYWKYQREISKPGVRKNLITYYKLFRLKRMDAANGAWIGTKIGGGTTFASVPDLRHGLRGIIIGHGVKFGKGAVLSPYVTCGLRLNGEMGDPKFGDNVTLGVGCRVIGDIKIGNNVIIGANAVVTKDVPDDSVVVGANLIHSRRRNK